MCDQHSYPTALKACLQPSDEPTVQNVNRSEDFKRVLVRHVNLLRAAFLSDQ